MNPILTIVLDPDFFFFSFSGLAGGGAGFSVVFAAFWGDAAVFLAAAGAFRFLDAWIDSNSSRSEGESF